jgi:hypothetical protein
MPTASSALSNTNNTDEHAQQQNSYKDARVHYADLKIRAAPPPTPASPHTHTRAPGRFEEAAAQRLMSQDPTVCQNPTPPNPEPQVPHHPHPREGGKGTVVLRGIESREARPHDPNRHPNRHPNRPRLADVPLVSIPHRQTSAAEVEETRTSHHPNRRHRPICSLERR